MHPIAIHVSLSVPSCGLERPQTRSDRIVPGLPGWPPAIPFLPLCETPCVWTHKVSRRNYSYNTGVVSAWGEELMLFSKEALVQWAGGRSSGCCMALPRLPDVTPDNCTLPMIHPWIQGEGSEGQVLW